jgi:hypothetical protein
MTDQRKVSLQKLAHLSEDYRVASAEGECKNQYKAWERPNQTTVLSCRWASRRQRSRRKLCSTSRGWRKAEISNLHCHGWLVSCHQERVVEDERIASSLPKNLSKRCYSQTHWRWSHSAVHIDWIKTRAYFPPTFLPSLQQRVYVVVGHDCFEARSSLNMTRAKSEAFQAALDAFFSGRNCIVENPRERKRRGFHVFFNPRSPFWLTHFWQDLEYPH